MAGYSQTPLIKKLGIKNDSRIRLIDAPNNFVKQLGALPAHVKIVRNNITEVDLILAFHTTEETLDRSLPAIARQIAQNGMIWVAWPKKSSGVETDLSFEKVQRLGLQSGLVDVKICAIDEVWSGLKFVYRLRDRSQS